ncbi:DivIVA domain-containing protein [Actinoalloteichus spitiensis]|uniref:DivIVA domain-containing protein n=1 Tax=Actinoalloteichus spitiensis TaxID=252394 RepID=UPI00037ACFEB|nr:DivIVA domain-containing protein [Actinoalloteichus spitiensis]
MGLTAADVRNVVIRKSSRLLRSRGYDVDEVDSFLRLAAEALDGHSRLTARDVRRVTFRSPPTGRRGYHQDDVDGLLDLVEMALRERGR